VANEWPTISRGAQRENFSQYVLQDPTIRSLSLDGRVVTRRGPRPILYGFSFSLRMLTAADKESLEQFQLDLRVGGETFTWEDTRPGTSTAGTGGSYTVRLAEPMIFDLDGEGSYYRTDVRLNQEPES